MPSPPSELKKALLERGFEVYRTTPDEIVLAERVRENLLMDSGVAVRTAPSLAVRLVVRACAVDFPGEGPDELFARARGLAATATELGYLEASARVLPIHDPGDRSQTLDTWYEVWLLREVLDIDALLVELDRALPLPKVVTPAR